MPSKPLPAAEVRPRPVRTYVLRQGRTSAAQKQACTRLLPRFGIPYCPRVLDLASAFGRPAPKMLEIGFGMGVATAEIAAAHPEQDFLALEVHTPGVGKLLQLIEEQSLTHIRLIQHEFVALLASRLASGGYLHLAADWEDYAQQILTVLAAEPSLENSAAD